MTEKYPPQPTTNHLETKGSLPLQAKEGSVLHDLERQVKQAVELITQQAKRLGLSPEQINGVLIETQIALERNLYEIGRLIEKAQAKTKKVRLSSVATTLLFLSACDAVPTEKHPDKPPAVEISREEMQKLPHQYAEEQAFLIIDGKILKIEPTKKTNTSIAITYNDIIQHTVKETRSLSVGHTHPDDEFFSSPPSLQDIVMCIKRTSQFSKHKGGMESSSTVVDQNGIWTIKIEQDSPLHKGIENYEIFSKELIKTLTDEELNIFYATTNYGHLTDLDVWMMEKSADPTHKTLVEKIKKFIKEYRVENVTKILDEVDCALRKLYIKKNEHDEKKPELSKNYSDLVKIGKKYGISIQYSGLNDK